MFAVPGTVRRVWGAMLGSIRVIEEAVVATMLLEGAGGATRELVGVNTGDGWAGPG